MIEFPSDDEPSMVQAVKLRRLRRKMYAMLKISSRARTLAMAPSGMERFFLRTATRLLGGGMTGVIAGGVLEEEKVLDDEEALDDEEELDEDVTKDEVGLISV